MIKLIKAELKKIFKKKSIYITIGIIIGLFGLSTIIMKFDNENYYDDGYFSDENINYLNSNIQKLNPNNNDDIDVYISLKSELDFINFAKKYSEDSWQRRVINEESYEIIYNINEQKYKIKNNEVLASLEAQLEELRIKFEENDWQSFVKDKKLLYESKINDLKETIGKETDKSTLNQLNRELEETKILLYSINYRLDNNVDYSDSYLNNAIYEYENIRINKLDYNVDNMTKEKEEEYLSVLKEECKQKYILDNKVDLNSYKSARNIFIDLIQDNIFLFVIFVVMIAGSIVSEEFNKGTIKMLLIRPYNRWKILASKYISCIIMLLFCITLSIIAQFLIGGIVFGFSSYSIPAIVFSYSKLEMIELPILIYQLLHFIALLPLLLLIMTLAFTISTIFTSSSIALTISYLTVFFSSVVNALIEASKIKILRFFPTMCWDLTPYLFGGKTTFEYSTLKSSIIADIIYLVILLFACFFVFKRKNVKNI